MNMWIRSGLASLASLLVISGTVTAQASPSMVFINSQRIMAEAPGLQEIRQQMQREMQRLEQQIVPLRTEYERLVEQFQQQQAMMSAERRREQQQAIGVKQQEIQELAARLDQEMEAKQQELLEPALEGINDVIDRFRTERGYAFIFDVAAGGVIAADPALDVTEEVLRRLRAVANR